MWELDYKESWAWKNWCFWTVVLEKTLESPLDFKEIQPVHPRGNQSWIFIGRTDAEAETLATWCEEPTHCKRPRRCERLKAGGEGNDIGRDSWMASLTQWTWVWASSGRWWRTGKPDLLQSIGLQRVRCDCETEQPQSFGITGRFLKQRRILRHSVTIPHHCPFGSVCQGSWVHRASPKSGNLGRPFGWSLEAFIWKKGTAQFLPPHFEIVWKNPFANAGDIRDVGSILGSGICPGEGNSNPLQYSCLGNPMDREAWQATVHGVTKSRTRVKHLSTWSDTHHFHQTFACLICFTVCSF